jgi:small subunit ribosomal protein S9
MAEEEKKPDEVEAPEKDATPKDAEGTEAPPATPPPPPEKPPEPSRTAPPLPQGAHYIWGTGRRKKAVARVRIRPGTGQFLVNKREVTAFFTEDRDRQAAVGPLLAVNMLKSWDVWANVGGGGFAGQAGAVTLGLARALSKAMPELESALRDKRLLTRDPRMVERKKPGQKGARKRFQFSKR